MLSAAAESTACLSDIEGELSMTQRKSTFAARASHAAKSSASESAATTRAPVVLVIAFIVLFLLPPHGARAPAGDHRTSKGGATGKRRATGCERAPRLAAAHDRVRRPCATREAHIRRHGGAADQRGVACVRDSHA